jgi:hypothetical protein
MPRIFDNIEQSLLPALRDSMARATRADFCIGYFNLRGWRSIGDLVEGWNGGTDHCCRLLIGMHKSPDAVLVDAIGLNSGPTEMDNKTAYARRKQLAEEYARQLQIGRQNADDEAGLQRLAAQLRAEKVKVKLHLGHALHAKLYLTYRADGDNPVTGFLGSSNLTMAVNR